MSIRKVSIKPIVLRDSLIPSASLISPTSIMINTPVEITISGDNFNKETEIYIWPANTVSDEELDTMSGHVSVSIDAISEGLVNAGDVITGYYKKGCLTASEQIGLENSLFWIGNKTLKYYASFPTEGEYSIVIKNSSNKFVSDSIITVSAISDDDNAVDLTDAGVTGANTTPSLAPIDELGTIIPDVPATPIEINLSTLGLDLTKKKYTFSIDFRSEAVESSTSSYFSLFRFFSSTGTVQGQIRIYPDRIQGHDLFKDMSTTMNILTVANNPLDGTWKRLVICLDSSWSNRTQWRIYGALYHKDSGNIEYFRQNVNSTDGEILYSNTVTADPLSTTKLQIGPSALIANAGYRINNFEIINDYNASMNQIEDHFANTKYILQSKRNIQDERVIFLTDENMLVPNPISTFTNVFQTSLDGMRWFDARTDAMLQAGIELGGGMKGTFLHWNAQFLPGRSWSMWIKPDNEITTPMWLLEKRKHHQSGGNFNSQNHGWHLAVQRTANDFEFKLRFTMWNNKGFGSTGGSNSFDDALSFSPATSLSVGGGNLNIIETESINMTTFTKVDMVLSEEWSDSGLTVENIKIYADGKKLTLFRKDLATGSLVELAPTDVSPYISKSVWAWNANSLTYTSATAGGSNVYYGQYRFGSYRKESFVDVGGESKHSLYIGSFPTNTALTSGYKGYIGNIKTWIGEYIFEEDVYSNIFEGEYITNDNIFQNFMSETIINPKSNSAVTIFGKCTPNSSIELYMNNVSVTTISVGDTGSWSYSLNSNDISNSRLEFVAVLTKSGNSISSDTFIVDTRSSLYRENIVPQQNILSTSGYYGDPENPWGINLPMPASNVVKSLIAQVNQDMSDASKFTIAYRFNEKNPTGWYPALSLFLDGNPQVYVSLDKTTSTNSRIGKSGTVLITVDPTTPNSFKNGEAPFTDWGEVNDPVLINSAVFTFEKDWDNANCWRLGYSVNGIAHAVEYMTETTVSSIVLNRIIKINSNSQFNIWDLEIIKDRILSVNQEKEYHSSQTKTATEILATVSDTTPLVPTPCFDWSYFSNPANATPTMNGTLDLTAMELDEFGNFVFGSGTGATIRYSQSKKFDVLGVYQGKTPAVSFSMVITPQIVNNTTHKHLISRFTTTQQSTFPSPTATGGWFLSFYKVNTDANDNTVKLAFWFGSDGNNVPYPSYIIESAPLTLSVNLVNLVITTEASNNVKIYLDKVEVATGTIPLSRLIELQEWVGSTNLLDTGASNVTTATMGPATVYSSNSQGGTRYFEVGGAKQNNNASQPYRYYGKIKFLKMFIGELTAQHISDLYDTDLMGQLYPILNLIDEDDTIFGDLDSNEEIYAYIKEKYYASDEIDGVISSQIVVTSTELDNIWLETFDANISITNSRGYTTTLVRTFRITKPRISLEFVSDYLGNEVIEYDYVMGKTPLTFLGNILNGSDAVITCSNGETATNNGDGTWSLTTSTIVDNMTFTATRPDGSHHELDYHLTEEIQFLTKNAVATLDWPDSWSPIPEFPQGTDGTTIYSHEGKNNVIFKATNTSLGKDGFASNKSWDLNKINKFEFKFKIGSLLANTKAYYAVGINYVDNALYNVTNNWAWERIEYKLYSNTTNTVQAFKDASGQGLAYPSTFVSQIDGNYSITVERISGTTTGTVSIWFLGDSFRTPAVPEIIHRFTQTIDMTQSIFIMAASSTANTYFEVLDIKLNERSGYDIARFAKISDITYTNDASQVITCGNGGHYSDILGKTITVHGTSNPGGTISLALNGNTIANEISVDSNGDWSWTSSSELFEHNGFYEFKPSVKINSAKTINFQGDAEGQPFYINNSPFLEEQFLYNDTAPTRTWSPTYDNGILRTGPLGLGFIQYVLDNPISSFVQRYREGDRQFVTISSDTFTDIDTEEWISGDVNTIAMDMKFGYSFSFWVKVNETAFRANSLMRIIDTDGLSMWYDTTTNILNYNLSGTTYTIDLDKDGLTLDDGNWHNVVLAYSHEWGKTDNVWSLLYTIAIDGVAMTPNGATGTGFIWPETLVVNSATGNPMNDGNGLLFNETTTSLLGLYNGATNSTTNINTVSTNTNFATTYNSLDISLDKVEIINGYKLSKSEISEYYNIGRTSRASLSDSIFKAKITSVEQNSATVARWGRINGSDTIVVSGTINSGYTGIALKINGVENTNPIVISGNTWTTEIDLSLLPEFDRVKFELSATTNSSSYINTVDTDEFSVSMPEELVWYRPNWSSVATAPVITTPGVIDNTTEIPCTVILPNAVKQINTDSTVLGMRTLGLTGKTGSISEFILGQTFDLSTLDRLEFTGIRWNPSNPTVGAANFCFGINYLDDSWKALKASSDFRWVVDGSNNLYYHPTLNSTTGRTSPATINSTAIKKTRVVWVIERDEGTNQGTISIFCDGYDGYKFIRFWVASFPEKIDMTRSIAICALSTTAETASWVNHGHITLSSIKVDSPMKPLILVDGADVADNSAITVKNISVGRIRDLKRNTTVRVYDRKYELLGEGTSDRVGSYSIDLTLEEGRDYSISTVYVVNGVESDHSETVEIYVDEDLTSQVNLYNRWVRRKAHVTRKREISHWISGNITTTDFKGGMLPSSNFAAKDLDNSLFVRESTNAVKTHSDSHDLWQLQSLEVKATFIGTGNIYSGMGFTYSDDLAKSSTTANWQTLQWFVDKYSSNVRQGTSSYSTNTAANIAGVTYASGNIYSIKITRNASNKKVGDVTIWSHGSKTSPASPTLIYSFSSTYQVDMSRAIEAQFFMNNATTLTHWFENIEITPTYLDLIIPSIPVVHIDGLIAYQTTTLLTDYADIKGHAQPGSTIKIYNNTTNLLTTITTDSNGLYSTRITGLSLSTLYTITATSTVGGIESLHSPSFVFYTPSTLGGIQFFQQGCVEAKPMFIRNTASVPALPTVTNLFAYGVGGGNIIPAVNDNTGRSVYYRTSAIDLETIDWLEWKTTIPSSTNGSSGQFSLGHDDKFNKQYTRERGKWNLTVLTNALQIYVDGSAAGTINSGTNYSNHVLSMRLVRDSDTAQTGHINVYDHGTQAAPTDPTLIYSFNSLGSDYSVDMREFIYAGHSPGNTETWNFQLRTGTFDNFDLINKPRISYQGAELIETTSLASTIVTIEGNIYE